MANFNKFNMILSRLLFILVLLTMSAQALCEAYIHHHERQHGIPHNLLRAISRIESGRNVAGQGTVAWPWTINANGKPYVLNTKAEAIAKVRELRSKGITSIDVGCMQINLKHHPGAFASLEEAFDPQKNIAYAAQFLKEKMAAQGNWQNAVAHYHSASTAHNQPYKNKVLAVWQQFGNSIAPMAAQPLNTIFNINKPKVVNTHFIGSNGRKMPINIKFNHYTGMRPPPPPSRPTAVIRTPGSLVNTNLTTGNGAKIYRANTSLNSKRVILPLTTIRRANVRQAPNL